MATIIEYVNTNANTKLEPDWKPVYDKVPDGWRESKDAWTGIRGYNKIDNIKNWRDYRNKIEKGEYVTGLIRNASWEYEYTIGRIFDKDRAEKIKNMTERTLYFEGAGCTGTDVNDVENCRIRTAFYNNDGEPIYLEILEGCKNIKKGKKYISLPGYLYVDFCHYLTEGYDDCNKSRINIERNSSLTGDIEYTKANIINLVNTYLNCSFTDMKVLHWLSGYRVHKDAGERNSGRGIDSCNFMDDFVDIPERTAERIRIYNEVAKDYFNEIYRKHMEANPSKAYLANSSLKYGAHSLVEMDDDTITLRSHTYKELIDDDERVKVFKVDYKKEEVA